MALTQPSLIPQPWGSDGQVGNIPQDSSEFGKASWAKGFPTETAQPLTEGGIPPSYLDFQGVLNALSAHAVFMQSGAHYTWSNTLDYPAGCFVLGSDGKLYQSLQASGPGYDAGAKNPTTNAAYWSTIVTTVNGRFPDSNGNVDVSGMPLGAVFPYTGQNVPAGTLRADGTTYTDMRSSFPEFYEWVVNSGLTVALGSYTLVEGSCGYYGVDGVTGTVRMPTLAAGVFGTTAAGQYGQVAQAGLPNITGKFVGMAVKDSNSEIEGAFQKWSQWNGTAIDNTDNTESGAPYNFDASRSSPVYGRSDTVTPSHVKYPWVIVVYNAAVPPSVAQAGEFIEMLDKLATALPTGTVVSHAGNKDLNGYLLCNGAAVSRTTYADLFAAIGTTYGAGNGSTTFNLPNLTDKFIQGSGTAGAVKEAGLPNITGSITHLVSTTDEGGNGANGAFCWQSWEKVGKMNVISELAWKYDPYFDASASNPIYGSSGTVQPPALTMRYYIKY